MTSLGQKILGRLIFIKEGRLQTVAAREMFKKCVEPKVTVVIGSILWSVICFNTDVRYHEMRKRLEARNFKNKSVQVDVQLFLVFSLQSCYNLF